MDSKASVPTSGSAVNTYYAIRADRRVAESARPLNHTCVSSTPEEPPRSFIEVQKQPHNDALTRYSDDVSRRGRGSREEPFSKSASSDSQALPEQDYSLKTPQALAIAVQ